MRNPFPQKHPVLRICQQVYVPNDVEGRAYLALAAEDLQASIHWFVLALHGRPDWQEALGIELDQLRNVLAAIEQEQEASNL